MKRFVSEFKTFITRGNVIDMAVGVIVGGAFTAIVNSLVGDVFTPVINLLTSKLSFSEWVIPIGTSQLMIGNFVQTIINFVLTALCLFILVHAITRMRELADKKEEEAKTQTPPAPPQPSKEELLLTEIRDLLAANAKAGDGK